MTTADLRTTPVLSKSIEAVREKVGAYVDRMNYVGKPVRQVGLFAGDYDACISAINRQRSRGLGRDAVKPEPITQLTWGGGGSGSSRTPVRAGEVTR